MSKEKTAPETELEQETAQAQEPEIETNGEEIPEEMRESIKTKIAELKSQHKVRTIMAVVVKGEEGDAKPYYIAYLRRPNMRDFSQYMAFVQKDMVQANFMLAQNVFVDGDRELINDEELFLFGLQTQLTHLIDSRHSELVKL